MDWLIWIGAALTLVGLAGLAVCVRMALGARRPGVAPDAARAILQRVVALNLGALGLSALGLAAVAAGILLG